MKTVKAAATPAIKSQLSPLAVAESELRSYFRAVKKADKVDGFLALLAA